MIEQLTSAKGKEADGTTLRLNEQLGYGYDASHNLCGADERDLDPDVHE